MNAAPAAADASPRPDHGARATERVGRGVLVFWSALLLFIAALVVWVPRHRTRPPALRPAMPVGPAAKIVPGRPEMPLAPPRTPVEAAEPAAARTLVMPLAGLKSADLHDSFAEIHSGHRHEAIDILAPRGTPVLAVDDGTIRKLFHSVPGGITIYEFDPAGTLCYYYAHLDRYASGLSEGERVRAGDVIGYVGTSGNAPPQTPHLHFAIYRLGPEKRWWEGVAVNPYPVLMKARPNR